MTAPNFKCDFDEDRKVVLYEIDSARVRRKVATKFKDGHIFFEPSYEKLSESQKEGYRIAINTCPQK